MSRKNTGNQRFSTSNTPELNNPARTRTDQCFSTSNAMGGEGGNARGNKGGPVPPDSMATFAELLHHEYGFSQAEVAKIVEAAKRVAVG